MVWVGSWVVFGLGEHEGDFAHARKDVVGVGDEDDDFFETEEGLGVEALRKVEGGKLAPGFAVGGEDVEEFDEGEDGFVGALEGEEEGYAALF